MDAGQEDKGIRRGAGADEDLACLIFVGRQHDATLAKGNQAWVDRPIRENDIRGPALAMEVRRLERLIKDRIAAKQLDELLPEVEKLLGLRGVIAQAVETARQAKQIGNALEGAVTVELGDEALLASLRGSEADLEEFFILSGLTLAAGAETKAGIVPTAHKKCARCWRYRASVGANVAHAELCERCAEVVTAL